MQSATARLRSLSLDDQSRALGMSELHAFTLAELRTATRNFTGSHFISEGGFGPVYKGFLDDRVKPGLEPMQVVVKCLDIERPQGHREWLAEVVYLGMLSHPHLVKLVGYRCQDDHHMLVYEYLAKASRAPPLQEFAVEHAVVDEAQDRGGLLFSSLVMIS